MKIGFVSAYGGSSVSPFISAGENLGLSVHPLALAESDYVSKSKSAKLSLSEQLVDDFDVLLVRSVENFTFELGLLLEYCAPKKIRIVDKGLYKARPLSINKLFMFDRLLKAGINLPEINFLPSIGKKYIESLAQTWTYPYVLKPIQGRRGQGVSLIKSYEEYLNYRSKYKNSLIKQKYIQSNGDYRVLVLGNKIIGSVWRKPGTNVEFKSLKKDGGERHFVDLPPKATKLAIKAAKVCGWEFAGVDLIQDDLTKKWLVLEVNRVPSFKMFSRVSGINVAEKVVEYLFQKN